MRHNPHRQHGGRHMRCPESTLVLDFEYKSSRGVARKQTGFGCVTLR